MCFFVIFLTLPTFQQRYIHATKALCLIHMWSGGGGSSSTALLSCALTGCVKEASGVVHNTASKLAP